MNTSVEGATVISRRIKVAAKRLPELRDQPAYHLTDAAAYVRLPVATLRSWVSERSYTTNAGRKSAEPLIVPADRTQRILSFNNLVEAHILRAFRRTHNLQMSEVRKALTYASQHLGIPRLLLSRKLLTDGVHLFIEQLEGLVNVSASGQIYWRTMLESQLRQVAWDASGLAYRLYPEIAGVTARPDRPLVAIDPTLSFGRAFIVSREVSTHTIVQRIDGGESAESLAEDYELSVAEVNAAVVFERQAA